PTCPAIGWQPSGNWRRSVAGQSSRPLPEPPGRWIVGEEKRRDAVHTMITPRSGRRPRRPPPESGAVASQFPEDKPPAFPTLNRILPLSVSTSGFDERIRTPECLMLVPVRSASPLHLKSPPCIGRTRRSFQDERVDHAPAGCPTRQARGKQ